MVVGIIFVFSALYAFTGRGFVAASALGAAGVISFMFGMMKVVRNE